MTMAKNKVRTLIIATRNAHKVEEIRAILGDGFVYQTLNDFPGAPKVIEDASTFAGNATKKAVELAKWLASTNMQVIGDRQAFVLADDSGLEVDALNGAPGVHSARFAALDESEAVGAVNSVDAANNAKLLRLLQNVPDVQRTARFRCTLALVPVTPQPKENRSPVCYADETELQVQLFDGACEGRIAFTPRGNKGFGYDPLFIPTGYQESFAQLGENVKNQMSHRSAALAKLREWFKQTGSQGD
jgi:XTP/dITP diphosphohydrolase